MLAPQRPSVMPPVLNQEVPGFFGEFGHGGNVEVRFLQSVVTHDFLSKIKLIEEINGSDKWNIKDLFQRNVDHDRVGEDLLPYLRDQDRVKFIPPLILVLLPMQEGGNVQNSLSTADSSEETVGDFPYNTFGNDDYFKFYDSAEGHHQYASVKWNDKKVNLVAVDGQHRLTAFKQWKDDPDQSDIGILESMSIPVVILGFSKYSDNERSPNLLDVVRNTFVYINSKSQKINQSRRILLDDESVSCVCTQEVVQYAHTNDQAEFENINLNALPLMIIDWRAEEKKGKLQPLPSSIFSVQDIHDWMHEFILGDSSPKSKSDIKNRIIPRLFLDHETPSFNVSNFPLTHLDSDTVRNRFKRHLLPAVVNVLEGIGPYKDYISELRDLERDSIDQTNTVARHAFKWIAFGKSNITLNRDAIEVEYNRLCARFGSIKEEAIPMLLTRDIGIRAIWSSFSFLKDELDNYKEETQDWLVFSNWYVGLVNKVIEDNWFEEYEEILHNNKPDKLKFLTYIAYGASGNVINYKPSAVNNGLGALITMLILKENKDVALLERAWENSKKDALSIPVRAGLRAKIRADMIGTSTGTILELQVELSNRVQEGLEEWIYSFEKYLGIG